MQSSNRKSRYGRRSQVAGVVAVLAAIVVTTTAHAPWAEAAVTGTVTPATGLTDGQVVRVQASGLPAQRQPIAVLQCERGALDSTQCDAITNDPSTQSNADGTFDKNDFTVYLLPGPTVASSSISCDSTHQCDIFVGIDYNDFSQPHTLIPVTFAGQSPTTTTTVPPSTTLPAPTTTTTRPATTTTVAGATTTIAGATTTTLASGATTTTLASTSAAQAATSTTLVSGASGSTTSTTRAGTAAAATGTGSGSSSASGSSGSVSGTSRSGSLPLTGTPPVAPWLALVGIIAVAGGSVVRRIANRAATRAPVR